MAKKKVMNYQSHEGDARGMSDSRRKLERLRFPDLSGKRFLDMGCNEGYFCHQAILSGASSVVGIDADQRSLELARERYSNESIDFRLQSWKVLPEGPFDVVLWSSAMHYEMDPKEVVSRVATILAPEGLLILECGVFEHAGREMRLAQRRDDSRWYPTIEYLTREILAPFSTRLVSPAAITEGDPVPRAVFHCTRRRPIVMLVRGGSGAGKSALAASISGATKSVGLDELVSRIAWCEFHHGDLQKLIRKRYDPVDLERIYNRIDAEGLTEAYADLVAEIVVPSDTLVVIEGFMTPRQFEAISRKLAATGIVWDVSRVAP